MAHFYAAQVLKAGEVAVDATAGNGWDTLFLARQVGPEGRVYAFDLQQRSLDCTSALLARENLQARVLLFQAGHEQMAAYIDGKVSVVMFNLGYLPGGDRVVVTKKETTLTAVQAALNLIRAGGLLTITAYPGHPEGKAEQAALIKFSEKLSSREYTVLQIKYLNRVKDPPALLLIYSRGA
jgi:predicted methyltransferase